MSGQPSNRDGAASARSPSRGNGLDAELDRAVSTGDAEAFLLGVDGANAGRAFPLNYNTVVLGRADDSDVCVADPSVSARHARIINSARGFEIEDLGSTNGTFIGGNRVQRGWLRNGDQVTLGTVAFSFLVDRRLDATIATIPSARRGATGAGADGGALIRRLPALPVNQEAGYIPPRSRPRNDDEDEGPSLFDVVARLIEMVRFLRQNRRLIVGLVVLGVSFGLVSILALPPSPTAYCVVKLRPQVKSNPMETQMRPTSDDDDVQFFAGAERTFTQPTVVAATLKKMEGADAEESRTAAIAGRLKFEALPDHQYRATYQGKIFGNNRPAPVEFLAAHVGNYVQGEIEKALKVFTAQADFLRDQLRSVEKDMGAISVENVQFREKNADRLPEEAEQTLGTRFTLESRRADLLAQVRRLQADLSSEKFALGAEGPLSQNKYRSSQVYRDSLASVNRKLSEAYARGLADGHPEIRELKGEKERIEGLVDKEMVADVNPVDRRSIAGYQELQNRVVVLQAQLSAAKSDLADTENSLTHIRTVVGDLPRVEERVEQLKHTQQATVRLHGQLFEQLKKAELQLNLERVSAESRYEVVVPPRLAKISKARTVATRASIGILIGLFLAAAVLAVREGRRVVGQTLATLDNSHRPKWQ